MMSEQPFDQPIQNISWADSGTQTEPSAGRRSTGWVAAGDRPSAEFNWRYNKMSEHIDYIDAYIPRKFSGADSALEAIGKIPIGDRVALTLSQKWYGSTITKETAGAVTHLSTDGRSLFYVVGLMLYAASASISTEPDLEWVVDVSGTFASIDHISTDGQIVALAGVSAGALQTFAIYTIADKGIDPDITELLVVDIGAAGSIVGVRADSISTTQRLWIGVDNDDETQGEVRIWTPLGGMAIIATLGTTLESLGMTDSALVLYDGSSTQLNDKTGYAVTASPLATTSINAFFGDGQTLYVLTTTDLQTIGDLSNLYPSVGVFTIPLAVAGGQEEEVIIGDGVAYTDSGAYSLTSGQLIELWDTPSDGPMALAGQYLWVVIGGDLVARPVGLRGGELWVRKSDGSDETVGRSDSELRLIMRQDQ